MTKGTAPVSARSSPPSIPSSFAIMREALRLYRRRFWAYFSVAGIAQAAMTFLYLVIMAAAGPLGPVPPWLSSLCRFVVEDIRSAPGMIIVVFCLEGLAVPTLVALALADARGARVSATEAFVGTLPRLHSFLVAWLPASLFAGVPMLAIWVGLVRTYPRAAVVVPGILLYVGVSLMEPVFVAERRGPFGALWRSMWLSWRRGVRSRLMALMLLPCAVWPVTARLAILPLEEACWGPFVRALRRLGIGFQCDFVQPALIFCMLALVTALLLPLFMVFKAILYHHAALLYPPAPPRDLRAPDAAQSGTDS